MSPEQVRGEPVDQRSDLYSMGVSLYEMVTGQLPFRGHSNYSVMSAHLQEPPQPPIVLRPDLPKGLSDIILMAMAKDPKDRFQSAEAFSNALKSTMSGAAGAGIVSPIPGTVRVPQGVPSAAASSGSGDGTGCSRRGITGAAIKSPRRLHGAGRGPRLGHSLCGRLLSTPHNQDPRQPGRGCYPARHTGGCSCGHLGSSSRMPSP